MSKMNIRNWDTGKIVALADANPEGFTVDIETGDKVTQGYAVGMTHGLEPQDAAVIANLIALGSFMPSSVYVWTIGGWKDNTGKYIIDVGFVTAWQEAAETFGKVYNQDAIYDLNVGQVISLKGD